MNYNTEVSKDFVDNLLESAMWSKGKIKVAQRIEEEASPVEEDAQEEQEDQVSFSYDDLQVVLENLEDDALLEHTLSMLDVLDSAYETLLESSDEDDEEEYEDEEEEEEEEDEDEELEEDYSKGYKDKSGKVVAKPGSAKAKRMAKAKGNM
tara:strand:- start:201 stop:653 length:453 start_codon:yes stop_codon:yes gene_type:complete